MARSELERVADILAAIADIRADTVGMDLNRFKDNPAVVRSVLYSIGVIGESVKHLGQEFRDARPDIPWRAIASMRDRIIHEYFRTNVRRIWDVVNEDIEPLERVLRDGPP